MLRHGFVYSPIRWREVFLVRGLDLILSFLLTHPICRVQRITAYGSHMTIRSSPISLSIIVTVRQCSFEALPGEGMLAYTVW